MPKTNLQKDHARMDFLHSLMKHCPTASFHFNDDPDVVFPDSSTMPVGFTIRVEEVEEPVRATGATFRSAVDKLMLKMGRLGLRRLAES